MRSNAGCTPVLRTRTVAFRPSINLLRKTTLVLFFQTIAFQGVLTFFAQGLSELYCYLSPSGCAKNRASASSTIILKLRVSSEDQVRRSDGVFK